MGLFDHFPYTNVHELNLDWVLSMMKALEAEWEAFTAGNSLTFANPMLHDVTKTYAKNTIVLDGNGNAYVSLQAVPVGVGLQNGDYWLMVFDYEAFIEKVNKNFTANYYRGSYRATAAMAIGDWLTVDDILYKATAAIAVDDILEDGVNITHFTLEDFIKAFMQSANQLIQQYKDDIDESERQYVADMQAEVDRILAGATVDSEVIDARYGADGVNYPTLGDAIRTQFTDLSEIVIKSSGNATTATFADCNDAPMNSIYYINDTTIANLPEANNGLLATISRKETTLKTGAVQIFWAMNTNTRIYMRIATSSTTWGNWQSMLVGSTLTRLIQSLGVATSATFNDCDIAPMNSIYYVNDTTIANLPESNSGLLATLSREDSTLKTGAVQIFWAMNANTRIYMRIATSSTTWGNWQSMLVDSILTQLIQTLGVATSATFNDCDIAPMNSIYYVNDTTIANLPESNSGLLATLSREDSTLKTGAVQIFWAMNANTRIYMRIATSSTTWGVWQRITTVSDIINYTSVSVFEHIGVIGDSWASGYTYPNGIGTNNYQISWPQILARICGCNATNYSEGGLTTIGWLNDADHGLAYLNSHAAEQLYIVALGINDTTAIDNQTMNLGDISDIDILDPDNNNPTFYGYYGKIVSAILNKNPDAKIILSTIPRTDKPTYETINAAIVNIGTLFSIPVINALSDPYFNTPFFINGKVTSHPTAPTYSGMANAYQRLIQQCMVSRYSYFEDYYG